LGCCLSRSVYCAYFKFPKISDAFDSPLRLPPTKPEGESIWVAGGTIDGSNITLRFFGDDLVPDELTQLLGVEPSIAYRKGDIFRGKEYDRIYGIGSWRLKSERAEIDLEEKIDRLLDKLPSDLEIWHGLTRKFQVDLFCGLWMKRWNRCIDFKATTLQRMAKRGLSIGLDIYVDYDLEEVSTED
jgi:Domain of unknown function (DUF4279)